MTVEEVDKLTGPCNRKTKNRPPLEQSMSLVWTLWCTWQTVSLRTVNTMNGMNFLHYRISSKTMMENKWLGSKTGQGFYKKVKNDKGKSEILTLGLGYHGVSL